jgi:chorismate synthase
LLAVFGVEVRSHVIQLGGIPDKPLELTWTEIAAIADDAPLHCADKQTEQEMIALIDDTRHRGDTLGGIFEVVARGVVPGLGSHTAWDLKLDGLLAQAVMSIPAVKALAIGAGAEASSLPGSEVHDEIAYNAETREFIRDTNRAGGLEGGITNGEEIRVRVYVTQIDAASLRDIHEVRSKFWTAGKYPASTLVRVDQLVRDGALIEVDADAVVAS